MLLTSGLVESVSASDIKKFLLILQRAKRKPSYINGLNKTFRSWFKYLLTEGYIKSTPMEKTAWAREEKIVIQTFTTTEMRKMVSVYSEASYSTLSSKMRRIYYMFSMIMQSVTIAGTFILKDNKTRRI